MYGQKSDFGLAEIDNRGFWTYGMYVNTSYYMYNMTIPRISLVIYNIYARVAYTTYI